MEKTNVQQTWVYETDLIIWWMEHVSGGAVWSNKEAVKFKGSMSLTFLIVTKYPTKVTIEEH